MQQLQEVIKAMRAGEATPQQAAPLLVGVWGAVRLAYGVAAASGAGAAASGAPGPAQAQPSQLQVAASPVAPSTKTRMAGKHIVPTPQLPLAQIPRLAEVPMDAEETPVPN